jgi:hypothetical protein
VHTNGELETKEPSLCKLTRGPTEYNNKNIGLGIRDTKLRVPKIRGKLVSMP